MTAGSQAAQGGQCARKESSSQPVPADLLSGAGDAVAGDVDGWLVREAGGRDEGAFEQLVRRHTPAMYAVALRATGSRELAQEVVQDAWLSAWLHLAGFPGHNAVRTWLVRIAARKALNALPRPQRTVPLEAANEVPVAGVEPDLERRERARTVRLAVAALPARQREAVVLRDLEGLSIQAVAAELGCSVSAVKHNLRRGRRALPDALREYRPAGSASQPRRVGQAGR